MQTTFIINLISRIAEQFRQNIIRELNQRNIKDLVPSHGEILYILNMQKKLTMNEIAKTINRSKPTVTVLARKLEKSGYIRKTSNANDSRSYYVELTEKGKDFIPILYSISAKILAKTFTGISNKQKSLGMDFLLKIMANL